MNRFQFWPGFEFNFEGIVLIIFLSAVFIQLMYVLFVHLRLILHKESSDSVDLPAVSVIICARNEEDNLTKNLPFILEQDYPVYEVIVVNDQSIDDSKHIIQAFQKKYHHLKHVELNKDKHRKFGKKLPLTVGIKGATYQVIALIDADCYPGSNQWLKLMMQGYAPEKNIVIGYGPYEKRKGFLNRLIRFDTASIALNYFGFAKCGRPYMAVGRNLSYTKDAFFSVEGFKNHYHIQSGDDDLFMQEAARKRNVSISLRPESFVYSFPKESWKAWVKQKQRHFTTASSYRLINKILLGIFPMSMVLMLISFFILLFDNQWWLFALSVFLFRLIIYWMLTGLVFKRLMAQDLTRWFPVMELVHFIVIPFIFYSTDRTDTKKW